MECNCNNNNNNGGVIPWVRGNRLPLCICIYQMNVEQETVGTMTHNSMTRTPYEIQADDTVTVTMKSGFRSVEMPFTTDGNKVLVIDNGELPTGTYTVEVTIERGSGERGRWQESRQVRIYENTDEAILGEMYSIEADLFFWAKGDTGNGIADITSNPDDTLTITMTDGTTYTTQAMKGDKGDKGDPGEKGTSIVSFDVTGQTETSVIYTVTFSDDTTEDVAVPKGPQGDTGLTGKGISSTTLNSDYTLTIAYTDGNTYTTPSIRGAQGVHGVSIIAFTQTGETSTNTLYNVVFSDGRTQSVAIPKGLKGDKGDTGPQGIQGPKGDTVTATDYTLYNVQGSDSQGAMSQDATTKAISAQTGYYTCGTAAGTAAKVVTVESGNVYKRTLGGHFKVKMTNANTASGVTLQVGSETATTLWYNGAAASADNSWEAGEIISVFYDGTKYMASNSQGGGGNKDEIKLKPNAIDKAINTSGITVGPEITTDSINWCYGQYMVDEGDVALISGTGGVSPRLWAIADENDNILSRSESNATENGKILVIPTGAKWLILNNNGNAYPNYKWFLAKKNSIGAKNLTTNINQQEEITDLNAIYDKSINNVLRSAKYAINENGKYGSGDVYYHFWYPVEQGQKYMIVPTDIVRYCFAKSHTVTKGGNIDLVNGTSVNVLSQGVTRIIEIPPTCNFLLLYFYDSTSNIYKYKDYLNDFPDIDKIKDCFYEKDVTSLVGSWACDDSNQCVINGSTWTLKSATNANGRIYIDVSSLTNGLLYHIHLKIISSDKEGIILTNLGYGSSPSNSWANLPVVKGYGSMISFPYGNELDVVFEKTTNMSFLYLASYLGRKNYPVVITVGDFYVKQYASFSTNYPSLEQTVNELYNNSPIPSTLPPNYTYERYMNLQTSQLNSRSSQAGCCYGNYFVQAFAANNSGVMGFRIYNLETKSLIQRVDVTGVGNHETHANAISFSINKFAEEDLFPLLYVPSGYPMTGTTTYQIYVIRFIGDTLGSLTAQIVQTINYEGSSWTDCVCDDAKERLWIITGGICECIELPDISNQTVTIDANTPRLHSFKIQPLRYSFGTTFISGQGMCFSQGRIWRITGVPLTEGAGSARIVVYNTKNMCTESMVFLEDIGLVPENTAEYEPEGIFIWNEHLYAAYRGFIAKIIKIDLV